MKEQMRADRRSKASMRKDIDETRRRGGGGQQDALRTWGVEWAERGPPVSIIHES